MVNKSPVDLSTGSSQYEYIKCVVVGDSGVGKTCLIRSWACDIKYHLEHLVKTHVSTVWATDHYRNDREVLERSWCHVDDVRVSLRLWDTFGYHDKDRSFAFKGADVVLVVFSVVKPSSLRNMLTKWYPEIRSVCPTTPIVVVGTHTDMRFMYKDKGYQEMNKGLLYKMIEKNDIILPEKGRDAAKEIGAPYYESSVLTYYGVEDVFFNVVRAAMVERRKLKFWNTQLRKIQYPLIQPPMIIPRPTLPKVYVAMSTMKSDLGNLIRNQADGDVIFQVQGVCFRAHKICLVAASETFRDLLLMDLEENDNNKCKSLKRYQSKNKGDKKNGNGSDKKNGNGSTSSKEDKQNLIDNEQVLEDVAILPNSDILDSPFSSVSQSNRSVWCQFLNHTAFEKIETKMLENPNYPSHIETITVVTMNPEIKPHAFRYILEYLYTGHAKEEYGIMEDVKRAAELLKLFSLLVVISNFQTIELFLNVEMEKRFLIDFCEKLQELALNQNLLADKYFEIEDGIVSAHKPLMMARCEMMFAMFNDNFREAIAEVIPLPGITLDVFQALQEYLYTDNVRNLENTDQLALIAVANRLCLQRLVHITELYIVTELEKADRQREDILEEALMLIEPSQFHNAKQLAEWCRDYVCCHYRETASRFGKLLRSLQKENLSYIEENQWPPAWYVKEKDRFDRLIGLKTPRLQIQQKTQFSRWQQCKGSCFCFCRRSKVVIDEENYDFPM